MRFVKLMTQAGYEVCINVEQIASVSQGGQMITVREDGRPVGSEFEAYPGLFDIHLPNQISPNGSFVQVKFDGTLDDLMYFLYGQTADVLKPKLSLLECGVLRRCCDARIAQIEEPREAMPGPLIQSRLVGEVHDLFRKITGYPLDRE